MVYVVGSLLAPEAQFNSASSTVDNTPVVFPYFTDPIVFS
jgi:hypothetical protein